MNVWAGCIAFYGATSIPITRGRMPECGDCRQPKCRFKQFAQIGYSHFPVARQSPEGIGDNVSHRVVDCEGQGVKFPALLELFTAASCMLMRELNRTTCREREKANKTGTAYEKPYLYWNHWRVLEASRIHSSVFSRSCMHARLNR